MSTASLIPLTQLDKSDLNVRTSIDKGAMQELQASILAHGLMQNLVVVKSKGNRYNVIAGGRRLAAMRALQKGGKLPKECGGKKDRSFEHRCNAEGIETTVSPFSQVDQG
jgi:ParB family transcriptional regulator, chromosome partitioning protein